MGDSDQSIYGWRHTTIENILNFQNDYQGCSVVNLGQNYRSTPSIVAAAGELIRNNRERIENPLSAERPDGSTLWIVEGIEPVHEAQLLIQEMYLLVEAGQCQWQDCAVLYRAHRDALPLEQVCTQRGVPYRILGGLPFFERAEIKDMVSYLKILNNPADSAAMQRIVNTPARDIGRRTIQKLMNWADGNDCTIRQAVSWIGATLNPALPEDMGTRQIRAVRRFELILAEIENAASIQTLGDLSRTIIRVTGMEAHVKGSDNGHDRWENVLELQTWIDATSSDDPCREGDLEGALEKIALVGRSRRSEGEEGEEQEPPMTMTTIHQAKGLEFETVGLCGLEDGRYPHFSHRDIEEERRLLCVGMTRAKRNLILSWCNRRGPQEQAPSRFLDEIETVKWPDEVMGEDQG